MTTWREVNIPKCPFAIQGYSHADKAALFAFTEGGVFVLCLKATPAWQLIADRLQESMELNDEPIWFNGSAIFFRDVWHALYGFPLLDDEEFADIPLLNHPSGQRLVYDNETDSARILIGETTVQSLPDFSIVGGATAGFSSDGCHLTYANAKGVRILEFGT